MLTYTADSHDSLILHFVRRTLFFLLFAKPSIDMNAACISSVLLALLPPAFPSWTETITSLSLENCLRKQILEKVRHFHLYGMSLEASNIFFSVTAASVPCALKANQFFCCNVHSDFWWYWWVLCISGTSFSSQWKPQRKRSWTPCHGQTNENEMEISGHLCGQMGENDEMKKNSLTLFCLLKLSSTNWNTNIIPMNA